jgi:hypothetical protein
MATGICYDDCNGDYIGMMIVMPLTVVFLNLRHMANAIMIKQYLHFSSESHYIDYFH